MPYFPSGGRARRSSIHAARGSSTSPTRRARHLVTSIWVSGGSSPAPLRTASETSNRRRVLSKVMRRRRSPPSSGPMKPSSVVGSSRRRTSLPSPIKVHRVRGRVLEAARTKFGPGLRVRILRRNRLFSGRQEGVDGSLACSERRLYPSVALNLLRTERKCFRMKVLGVKTS